MIVIEFNPKQYRARYIKTQEDPDKPSLNTTLRLQPIRLFGEKKGGGIELAVSAASSSEPTWRNLGNNPPDGLYEYSYFNGINEVSGEILVGQRAAIKVEIKIAKFGADKLVTVTSPITLCQGDLFAEIRAAGSSGSIAVPLITDKHSAQFRISSDVLFSIVLGDQISKLAETKQ